MSDFYGWRPTNAAKLHLDESERRAVIEAEAARSNSRNDQSHAWLADYRSHNRPTRFDWSPKLVTHQQIEEITNVQEAEIAFQRLSQEAAQERLCEGMGDAAQEGEHPDAA